MIVKLNPKRLDLFGPKQLSLRCPGCRKVGTFQSPEPVTKDLRFQSHRDGDYFFGHRICPNSECGAHVFAIRNSREGVVATYPPERIDFDTNKIPKSVVAPMQESVTCHANGCYMASAMLVRKTLEALCTQEKATGKDLKKKLKDLEGKVTLPPSLFSGLQDLRLLGNDAAHIEKWTYEDVGKEEAEIAIELTKEILKALYQHADLVEKLRRLKADEEKKD